MALAAQMSISIPGLAALIADCVRVGDFSPLTDVFVPYTCSLLTPKAYLLVWGFRAQVKRHVITDPEMEKRAAQ